MTDEELQAIRVRSEKTTEGPWVNLGDEVRTMASIGRPTLFRPYDCTWEDREFIAHARTDIPALLAEIDRLRTQLQITRGALADIAHMSTREVREVAQRKALRIYEETA